MPLEAFGVQVDQYHSDPELSFGTFIKYISSILGCQDDVEEMVRQSSDLHQVAEWACVCKKEYTIKKEECRRLKKREMDLRSRQLNFRDLEIKLAKSQKEQAKQESALKNYSEKVGMLLLV